MRDLRPLVPVNEEGLDEIARSLLEEIPSPPGSISGNSNFSLENLIDSYRITGVQYKNGIYAFDLYKELLPSRTQNQHAEHRKQVMANNTNEPYTPTFPELNAFLTTLFQNKDNTQYKDQIEQVRQFIKDSALKNWLMTLTRVQYNPQNKKDIVTHNYKQQDQYTIELDSFIGTDGFILNPDTTNVLIPVQALLDTRQSLQEINQVYRWLTDVDAYMWRLNSTPNKSTEAVAGLNANSYGAGLDCNGDPGGSSSSLGVHVAKIRT